jgi:hypothetical protein
MSVLRARQPVDLEETRGVDRPRQRQHGRIEPLGVADHQQAGVGLGGAVERFGLLERAGQGFLDQHVQTALEQRSGHAQVIGRGHRDARRLHLAHQLFRLGEGPAVELLGDRAGALPVAVEDADQPGLW